MKVILNHMSLPEIINLRVLNECSLEIILRFNGVTHYIRSLINRDNLYYALEHNDEEDEEDEEEYDRPSQSDWNITTNVPELKFLCKSLHYKHMIMAQEVSDYIDDHFEERILDKGLVMGLQALAHTFRV